MNKVLSRTEKRSRLEAKSIFNDNRIYTDGFEICELINEIFSSVSSRIHESIPPTLSDDDFSYYLRHVHVNNTF